MALECELAGVSKSLGVDMLVDVCSDEVVVSNSPHIVSPFSTITVEGEEREESLGEEGKELQRLPSWLSLAPVAPAEAYSTF